MLKVLVFSDIAEVSNLIKYLFQKDGHAVLVETVSNPDNYLSDVIEYKPHLVAMKMEWHLTLGFRLANDINGLLGVNVEYIQELLPGFAYEDGKMFAIGLEELIAGLIAVSRSKLLIDDITVRNVTDYYTRLLQQKMDVLTGSEKVVLRLLIDGNSVKMIADQRDISAETVKTHLRNIYRKLGVHNANAAIALVLKEKVVL